jgi:hypothetical protein
MSALWLPLAVFAAAIALGGLYILKRRPEPLCFANDQEERLTRRLAQDLGCSLGQALPAIRHEVELAPHQSDETLLKRAAYHYRQSIPERTCNVYRDKVRG